MIEYNRISICSFSAIFLALAEGLTWKPTIMASENFGIYLKGGIAKVTVETLESGAMNSTYANQDVYGTSLGFGAKLYTGQWYWKLDYLETDYGEVSITSSSGESTITAEPEAESMKLSLGYNF